jgi:hypothetical protein
MRPWIKGAFVFLRINVNMKALSEEEEEGLYKLTINDQQIYLPTALRELLNNHH